MLPSRLAAARGGRLLRPPLVSHAVGLATASAFQPPIEIYQYEICPFCSKVKAFLDWQKLAYRTIEVNPLSKAEIKFSSEYRKVPIVMLDNKQINDSSAILAALSGNLPPADTPSDADTAKWLQWCDKELAVLLFPNITRNFGESWQAFKYISEVPTFGTGAKVSNQLAGSLAMWLANGKLKKKYNIVDERKELSDTIKVWVDAVGSGPFLRGETLTLPDVAVYGVISAIRGLAAYEELMVASPELARWRDNVKSAIGGSSRLEDPPVVRHFGMAAI